MDTITGWLPGGYVDHAGVLHRAVELTPLTGREEELLAENQRRESASVLTLLLSRCVRRIGALSPVSEEIIRDLIVADRQYLVVKLRQVTFGDWVRANIFCPWQDCGKRVSVHFSLEDIPIQESEGKGPVYAMTLSPEAAGGLTESERRITFRLPTGADQEAISPLLQVNEARALTALLESCITTIGSDSGRDEDKLARLTPRARAEIEMQMELCAPKVDLLIEVRCSECGRTFELPFDLHSFFFGELRASRELLYRQVHYLAFHYHWSEHEIMDMTRAKRHKYIEVLADEIERMNNAD